MSENLDVHISYPYPCFIGHLQGVVHSDLKPEPQGCVFYILRENNPELAINRRQTVMRPPQVLWEGRKKTVFVNFMDLCKTVHRQPEHVLTFLLDEMGTRGSLDGQQRLVVKGRFGPKFFEGILQIYVTSLSTIRAFTVWLVTSSLQSLPLQNSWRSCGPSSEEEE